MNDDYSRLDKTVHYITSEEYQAFSARYGLEGSVLACGKSTKNDRERLYVANPNDEVTCIECRATKKYLEDKLVFELGYAETSGHEWLWRDVL